RTYEATMGEWKNFMRTTAKKAQSDFIQALDEMYIKVTSGTVSYSQGFLECIEKIAEKGVVVDFPKRTDTIETAALRCVRTGISQMSGEITEERMKEMNWDIVLVSSHLGARVTKVNDYTNHSWWQGKFYSLSGMDSRFPPYSVCGEGKVQGIHGANCRHSKGPGDGVHNPFADYDSEENLKAYKIQQRQRLLERRIRNTKRETMNLKTAVDLCKDEKEKFELDIVYQRKAALLQKQNQDYKDYCNVNNLKELYERIAIARWDRRQAAAARGAAQRYRNAKED
ncbi:MAG: phage capsid protein, partial [Lachnospiraceae bacterium]|nr:phage capsid protein [Lachnospiraceae bacterium]